MIFQDFYAICLPMTCAYRSKFWLPIELDPAFFEQVPHPQSADRPHQTRAKSDLLSCTEAASALGLSAKTLANWRVTGSGPKFVKLGGRVGYRMTDLENFITQNRKASTSEGVRRHV